MTGPVALGPGVFPDICRTLDGWLVVYREPAGSIWLVWLDGDLREQTRVAIDAGSAEDSTFARVLTWRSRQFVIYRALRAGVWCACWREVTGGALAPEQAMGVLHTPDQDWGNEPACFSSDGWVAWQDFDTQHVEGFNLADLRFKTLRAELRPTGLARCDGGTVLFVDEVRASVPGMSNPVIAGACTVGENGGAGGGVRVLMADGAHGVLLAGDCFIPRVADGLDGTFAAATWNLASVQVVRFAPSELTEPPSVVPGINKPCAVGWFHFGTAVEDAPGNVDLQVDGDMILRDRATGRALAAYAAGSPDGDVAALDAAILARHAQHPDLPVLAYWTAAAQAVRIPIGAEILGVEGYWHAGESLEALERRLRDVVAVCPCAVLIADDYTSNAANNPDVVDNVAVYARVARDCRNVIGIVGFSSGSRETGYDSHPESHAAWTQLAGSVLGLPTFPGPTPPSSPAPVPSPVPPPPKPQPAPTPAPVIPADGFHRVSLFSLGGFMQTERGGIVGPGGKFGRISAADAGKGLFGWFPLHFDADSPDGDAAFDLSDLGGGYFVAKHVTTGADFGVDMTKFSADLTKQFYGKPAGEIPGPGSYEAPIGFVDDQGVRFLIVKYGPSADVPAPFYSTPVSWVKA